MMKKLEDDRDVMRRVSKKSKQVSSCYFTADFDAQECSRRMKEKLAHFSGYF